MTINYQKIASAYICYANKIDEAIHANKALIDTYTALISKASIIKDSQSGKYELGLDLNKLSVEHLYQDSTVYKLFLATKVIIYFVEPQLTPEVVIAFYNLKLSTAGSYEIFVYAETQQVFGCHIRYNKLARGGIRLANKQDNYRCIALGLAGIQDIKNSVISVGGGKGCFVNKGALSDLEAYKIFILGLLSYVNVEDPYLLIAADRGTGNFSDTANQLAKDYNYPFYLVFASGTSSGYSHQQIGITSKGLLTNLKFKLANYQHDALSCVGIGSMRGDVFGNFIRIAHEENIPIKLIAAFNSTHIYLNPNATVAGDRQHLSTYNGGWAELDMPSSTVIPIGDLDKKLHLPHTLLAFLGLEDKSTTSSEVIRAILALRSDIWFNGAINIFVSSQPSSTQILPEQLRCSMILEGGNMGIEDEARAKIPNSVSYNGDFIDNSAAVRLSDYEVNYRLALLALGYSGTMLVKELADIKEYLVQQCLEDLSQDLEAIGSLAASDSLVELLAKKLQNDGPASFKYKLSHASNQWYKSCILHNYLRFSLRETLELAMPTSNSLKLYACKNYFQHLPVLESLINFIGHKPEHLSLRNRFIQQDIFNRVSAKVLAADSVNLILKTNRSDLLRELSSCVEALESYLLKQ